MTLALLAIQVLGIMVTAISIGVRVRHGVRVTWGYVILVSWLLMLGYSLSQTLTGPR